MIAVPPGVACPLASALLLALLPDRVGGRLRLGAGLAAALATLVLAAAALVSPSPDAAGPWLSDRLARSLPVLAAIPGVLASAWLAALPLSAQGRVQAGRWRRLPAAVQLLGGGAILACRAAPLSLMLIGVALLLLAALLLLPRRPQAPVLFAAMLLTSWLGAAILSAGLGRPAGWTVLPAGFASIHPGLRSCGPLLLLLPMLLLAWIGAAGMGGTEPVATPEERCAQALLPVLLAIPGLVVALRLRALPEPDPGLLRLDIAAIVGIGLLGLLLAVALMPGRRRPADRVALAAAVQLGTAVVGIGVGGTGGVAAALMILFFLALAVPVSLLPVGSAVGVGLRRLGVLALAGLPPFGPFAAAFLLLLRLSGTAPALALLVLVVLAVAGLSLLPSVLRPSGQAGIDAAVPRSRVALLPGLVALALLGWLGLAMPGVVSDWLLGMSEAAAGASWPVAESAR